MHHGAGLRKLTKDDALVRALSDDYREASLEPAERAMLDFVAKLTLKPRDMERADLEALRAVGFDDRSIHDIVFVAGYYAFVNRVADGLGVSLEPDRKEP